MVFVLDTVFIIRNDGQLSMSPIYLKLKTRAKVDTKVRMLIPCHKTQLEKKNNFEYMNGERNNFYPVPSNLSLGGTLNSHSPVAVEQHHFKGNALNLENEHLKNPPIEPIANGVHKEVVRNIEWIDCGIHLQIKKGTNVVTVVENLGARERVDSKLESSSYWRTFTPSPFQLNSEVLESLSRMNHSFSIKFQIENMIDVEGRGYVIHDSGKLVIFDIDGTISKSDFLGVVFEALRYSWFHDGVAELIVEIQKRGYFVLLLTARPFALQKETRFLINSLQKRNGEFHRDVPIILSHSPLKDSFPSKSSPKKEFLQSLEESLNSGSGNRDMNRFFHAGFGNRLTDKYAYSSVEMDPSTIFLISPKRLWNGKDHRFKGYKELHRSIDKYFPWLCSDEESGSRNQVIN